MTDAQYFSGQGKLKIADRLPNGQPDAFRWLGDVSDVTQTTDEKTTDYNENFSGNRTKALSLKQGLSGKITCKILQVNKAQYDFLFRGLDSVQASGTVTGHVVGSAGGTLAVGQSYSLDAFKVSAVTVKDSTGSPITLTPGVNYVLDGDFGSIDILDVTTGGPFVMPLVIDYTKAAVTGTTMFTAPVKDYWIKFEGKNTAVAGYPKVVAEWYKARPTPVKQSALINDGRGEYDVEFDILIDTTKSATGPFGQFGRIVDLT